MSGVLSNGETGLEVVEPGGSRRFVRIAETPFSSAAPVKPGKHLQLKDPRISRQCAAIVLRGRPLSRGSRPAPRHFRQRRENQPSHPARWRRHQFRSREFYELIFRSTMHDTSIPDLLSRIESISSSDAPPADSTSSICCSKPPRFCIPGFRSNPCLAPCWTTPSPSPMRTAVFLLEARCFRAASRSPGARQRRHAAFAAEALLPARRHCGRLSISKRASSPKISLRPSAILQARKASSRSAFAPSW